MPRVVSRPWSTADARAAVERDVGIVPGSTILRPTAVPAETDRLWAGLLEGGGSVGRCGWIEDRWGLSRQVVQHGLGGMIADPDRARARRVSVVVLGMVKLDIAASARAYHG